MYRCEECYTVFEELGIKTERQGYLIQYEQALYCCPNCGNICYEELEQEEGEEYV